MARLRSLWFTISLLGLLQLRVIARTYPPPNLIVILCDDMGYGDLAVYGNQRIHTPNLDRMAAEGMRFTDFHAADSVCSPSRAALLTGRYPIRTGVTRVLFPYDKIGLSTNIPTLSSVLKGSGYDTMAIGKWHLGHHPEFLPRAHGFDHYFGIPYSNDMGADPAMKAAPGMTYRRVELPGGDDSGDPYPGAPLMRDDWVIEHPVDQTTLTRRYTDEALQFLAAPHPRPFFLYLAHTMPHVPLAVSLPFRGHSAAGLYGDVIEELDTSVGEILNNLRQSGLATNILVVFTSDNGPWLAKGADGGSAGELRDGKFSQFEGGHREPAIAWWPGRVPAGHICTELVAAIDLFPTFCHIAGLRPPAGIDGLDQRPLLLGTPGAHTPHKRLFHSLSAVREGDWKYVTNKQGEFLFNLSSDQKEQKNLAESNPAKLVELRTTLNLWRSQTNSSR